MKISIATLRRQPHVLIALLSGVMLIGIVAVLFRAGVFGSEEARALRDTERLLADVSRHMLLPESGSPSVATINDPEALASQDAFFAGTIVGDRLIVYPNKAIIYRPSADILINVGPVYFDETTTE